MEGTKVAFSTDSVIRRHPSAGYMLAQGPSQAVVSLEWDSIWAIDKKVIDLVTLRFGVIGTANMCVLLQSTHSQIDCGMPSFAG